MADQNSTPENLTLHSLRAMHAKLDSVLSSQLEATTRLSAIEKHMAALVMSTNALTDKSTDHELRLRRIERRLELAD